MTSQRTALHLFAGLGGGSLGFQRAGFTSVGAFDLDPAACRDLTYLTGNAATPVDLCELEPAQLRRLVGERRPDVVFTSPPCKSFSGLLSSANSQTAKYRAMSTLAYRGIWLSMEAWKEQPPPLFVMENVPRIMTRGRVWLDEVTHLLERYGYAVRESTHDCGELAGLAQSRRRFLLVARHRKQVGEYMYTPPKRPLSSIGSAIGGLPVPVPGCDGGRLHTLPRLSAKNWVRLALIRAGKDWHDLPPAVGLTSRASRHNGGYGVNDWHGPAHTVVGEGSVQNTWASTADPRLSCAPYATAYGVEDWDDNAGTVAGAARHDNGAWAVADPRWPVPTHDVEQAEEGLLVVVGPELDLKSRRSANPVPIIRSLDGTWHRPLTTLELAVLQGFPAQVNSEWLQLDGGCQKEWRKRIGNAVPPPAAEAIARECMEVLQASEEGTYRLRGEAVWVEQERQEVSQ